MHKPNRREMLGAGAGLGVVAVAADAAWAAPATAPSLAPREVARLDAGWRFHLGNAADPARDFGFGANQSAYAKSGQWTWLQGPVTTYYDDSVWAQVDLPHDWAVELPFAQPAYLDPAVKDDVRSYHGYKPLGREFPDTSIGWYRRAFTLPAADRGRRISLEFEGVFRDCLVFVNGYIIGHNASGYAPFRVDITDVANIGGANVVTLRVDASEGEGWFYEGAGVYRHVWLVKTDPVHVPQWGTFVRTTPAGAGANVILTTEVANEGDAPRACEVVSTITDPNGKPVGMARGAVTVAAWSTASLDQQIILDRAALWSVETPQLYRLDTEVVADGRTTDRYATPFGVRTVRFDPDLGFFLNEVPVKLKGTCNHQDHAGVGAAVPDRLNAFRIERLKAMGSNAYRTSHNAPSPSLLDACDRLGMLVLDETRRMSADPEALDELARMVRRDRNRPSVILWSIGNEEPHQIYDAGAHIAETMKRLVYRLDGTRLVTEAMNYGWGTGVSRVLDVVGFNYSPKSIAPFHAKFPKTPILCTETASTVTTRAVYVRDAAHQFTSAYDVEAPPWAQTAEHWWPQVDASPYIAGGFIWTGFDYRGEPTPFNRWPSVASYFGVMDSCGFAKDEFYYYKAWWGAEPQAHLLPHWTWPGHEGKPIDVWCYANVDRVELFLNGKSLGSQTVVRNGHLAWSVPYAPGVLEAHGYRGERLVARDRRETAGPAAKVVLSADRTRLAADNADLAVVAIAILDSHGRPVPDAANAVKLDISGAGALIGMGNGDPTSHEMDKADSRRAFKGLAMGLVQARGAAGAIRVRATADGLSPSQLVLTTA
jgi:beta-galactosidase